MTGQTNEPRLITDIIEDSLSVMEIQTDPDVASACIGLRTGYHELDSITYGLRPGHLIVVAGRPTMGKSLLAQNFAEQVCLETDLPVVFFTLEKTSADLILHMYSSLGRVDIDRVQTGNFSDDDWDRISMVASMLNKRGNLYIDDSPWLIPAGIRQRSHAIAEKRGGMGMVVVDSLQLITADKHRDTRTAELSDITRSLKALAKELSCPVVLVSQLNRQLEQRSDKRPVLYDLRDSGSIEQDGDVIMFIYRDEVYHPDGDKHGLAEIIIGKHSYGVCGSTELAFHGQYSRFDNYFGPDDQDDTE